MIITTCLLVCVFQLVDRMSARYTPLTCTCTLLVTTTHYHLTHSLPTELLALHAGMFCANRQYEDISTDFSNSHV